MMSDQRQRLRDIATSLGMVERPDAATVAAAVLDLIRVLDAAEATPRIPCRQCGAFVEPVRHHYATPVCFACIPPKPSVPPP